MRLLIAMLCLTMGYLHVAQAEEESQTQSGVPEAPAPPLPVQSGENLEPEITIIKRDGRIIHEYSVNGTVYMVKIVPTSGPAYYLVDKDGDGNMETRHSDLEKGIKVPQWLLYKW